MILKLYTYVYIYIYIYIYILQLCIVVTISLDGLEADHIYRISYVHTIIDYNNVYII